MHRCVHPLACSSTRPHTHTCAHTFTRHCWQVRQLLRCSPSGQLQPIPSIAGGAATIPKSPGRASSGTRASPSGSVQEALDLMSEGGMWCALARLPRAYTGHQARRLLVAAPPAVAPAHLHTQAHIHTHTHTPCPEIAVHKTAHP